MIALNNLLIPSGGNFPHLLQCGINLIFLDMVDFNHGHVL